MFMAFWYVQMVGINSRINSLQLSRNLVALEMQNIDFLLISSIFQGSPRKVECLRTCHITFSTGLFSSEPPQTIVPMKDVSTSSFFKNNLKPINKLLFETLLFSEMRVSKNQGLVSGSPPGDLKKMTPTKIFSEQNVKPPFVVEMGTLLCLFLFLRW